MNDIDQEDQIKNEPLYQVWATEIQSGKLVPMPMFPRVMKDVADEYASTVRMMIAAGKETRYKDPESILYLGHRNS